MGSIPLCPAELPVKQVVERLCSGHGCRYRLNEGTSPKDFSLELVTGMASSSGSFNFVEKMTSIAWPNQLEWFLWYTGEKDLALKHYFADDWRDCTNWPKGPPTREEVIKMFEAGKTSMIFRRKTPYERFLIKNILPKYEKVFCILKQKYNMDL